MKIIEKIDLNDLYDVWYKHNKQYYNDQSQLIKKLYDKLVFTGYTKKSALRILDSCKYNFAEFLDCIEKYLSYKPY